LFKLNLLKEQLKSDALINSKMYLHCRTQIPY